MAYKNQKLVLGQVNAKIRAISALGNIPPPGQGWINGIRIALNMTMEQLANKVGVSVQSISEAEQREREGSITLKSLAQIAQAIEMKLVYGIVPDEGDLENKIDQKASAKAKEIVDRTSQTMALEDQANSEQRLMQMIEEKKKELIDDMPKFLWE